MRAPTHGVINIGDRLDDGRQGCVRTVPGRRQLHANGQFGAEEAGLSVSDELCEIATGHGHHGREHVRQGRLLSVVPIHVICFGKK